MEYRKKNSQTTCQTQSTRCAIPMITGACHRCYCVSQWMYTKYNKYFSVTDRTTSTMACMLCRQLETLPLYTFWFMEYCGPVCHLQHFHRGQCIQNLLDIMPIYWNPWVWVRISLARNSKQVLHKTETTCQQNVTQASSLCWIWLLQRAIVGTYRDSYPFMYKELHKNVVPPHLSRWLQASPWRSQGNKRMLQDKCSQMYKRMMPSFRNLILCPLELYSHHQKFDSTKKRLVTGKADWNHVHYLICAHGKALTCSIWMACFRAWLFSGVRGSCTMQDMPHFSAHTPENSPKTDKEKT